MGIERLYHTVNGNWCNHNPHVWFCTTTRMIKGTVNTWSVQKLRNWICSGYQKKGEGTSWWQLINTYTGHWNSIIAASLWDKQSYDTIQELEIELGKLWLEMRCCILIARVNNSWKWFIESWSALLNTVNLRFTSGCFLRYTQLSWINSGWPSGGQRGSLHWSLLALQATGLQIIPHHSCTFSVSFRSLSLTSTLPSFGMCNLKP